MIDLVTVVFRDELSILRLQAQSINQYCQYTDIGRIYIVVNDDTVDVSEIELSWWGVFRSQVTVVHRRAWPVQYSDNGWLTQQLLKLLATDLCTSEWSMVLDAKTIFIKPVANVESKPQVGALSIQPVFEPSQQIVSDLFDITFNQQLGPGGVPFILNNTLVKEMLEEISIRTGQSFADWFQDQGMVTEFILYSGYVIYKYGSFDFLYDTNHCVLRPCNICHSEVNSFKRKFDEMQSAGTVSIHRNAWNQLTVKQQQQYQEFLSSRGIQ